MKYITNIIREPSIEDGAGPDEVEAAGPMVATVHTYNPATGRSHCNMVEGGPEDVHPGNTRDHNLVMTDCAVCAEVRRAAAPKMVAPRKTETRGGEIIYIARWTDGNRNYMSRRNDQNETFQTKNEAWAWSERQVNLIEAKL